MDPIVWLFKFLLKAAIFFTLFACALNNQGEVTVNFFFGTKWSSPLVLVVLIAFAMGLAIGVLGMVPRWWRHRRAALTARQDAAPESVTGGDADRAPISRPYGL